VRRRSKLWIAAVAAPAALVVACAAAVGVLELMGAECRPDKIWGDCNEAAQMQVPVFLVGLVAAAVALVVALLCALDVLARRHRSDHAARGGG
jgi:hypothetical protein